MVPSKLRFIFRNPYGQIDRRCMSNIVNSSSAKIVPKDDESDTFQPAKYHFRKLEFNCSFLSQTIMKTQSKKKRDEFGLIMLEGKRLIQEAIDSGCQMETLFFSRTSDLNDLNLGESKGDLFKTSYKNIKEWSSLTTPPGIIGIFRKPKTLPESQSSLPLTLICDQIREPGNLGAIIRNCAGVGVRRVILTRGCTDLWNIKALRGGAGAHFKVTVRPEVDWEEIESLVQIEGSKLLLASNKDATVDSPFARMLPLEEFHRVDYTETHNFVVVGGESEGLSSEAYQVAARTNGFRITIPLENDVESLNSVSAGTIIMFEIKRQFLPHRAQLTCN